jgi:hypothetical protein
LTAIAILLLKSIPQSFIEGSVANIVTALSAQGLPVTAKKLIAMTKAGIRKSIPIAGLWFGFPQLVAVVKQHSNSPQREQERVSPSSRNLLQRM